MIIRTLSLKKEVPSSDGNLIILEDINLELEQDKSLAIVGPSGSGKSTLLSLLAGLDTATSGEVYLDENPLHIMDEDQRAAVRKEKVAFVFQSFELLPGLNALENVMLPAEIKNLPYAEELAKEYLEKVGLEKRYEHYPKQLSGGEQQRVAIARAFACKAKILFVDEPTGNLDPKTGKKIIDLFFRVYEESSNSLIVVTHDIDLAQKCDKQIELKEGKII
mgnify:FL=1|tara:strand:- start:15736 stop:16395 length:660 start_codon:yes stop_codon:yes gene_type:complete